MFAQNSSVLMPLIHKKFTWQKPIVPRNFYRPIRICHRDGLRVHMPHLTNVSSHHEENLSEGTGEAQEAEEDSESQLER